MNTSIATIYENGVLRPLSPLSLPERARVRIYIEKVESPPDRIAEHRLRVEQILVAAGLSLPRKSPVSTADLLTEEQRAALAKKVSDAGPVSDLIIEERRTGP